MLNTTATDAIHPQETLLDTEPQAIVELRTLAASLDQQVTQSISVMHDYHARSPELLKSTIKAHIHWPDEEELRRAAIDTLVRAYTAAFGLHAQKSKVPDDIINDDCKGYNKDRYDYRCNRDPKSAVDSLTVLLTKYPPEMAKQYAKTALAGALWSKFWLSRESAMKMVSGYVCLTVNRFCGGGSRLEYPHNDTVKQTLEMLAEVTAVDEDEHAHWLSELCQVWKAYEDNNRPMGRDAFPANRVARVIYFKDKVEFRITQAQGERLNAFFAENIQEFNT